MSKPVLLSSVALVLVLVACGDDDTTAAPPVDDDGEPTVEIVRPADGAEVSVPFTLVVDSSEDLGPSSSGNHHVRLYVDGDNGTYEMIEAGNGEEYEVTADSPALAGVDAGEHTLNVSLRDADQSDTGAQAEVTVTISPGDSTGDDEGDDDGDDVGDDDTGDDDADDDTGDDDRDD
jgi:hypothetical protein